MTIDFIIKKYHRKDVIFKHLHLGTNLPVFESFRKYIYREINHMGCFSIVLKDIKLKETIAHCLLYPWERTLYFGFFYAKGDTFNNVQLMLDEIKNQALLLNCTNIFGPVNLPPYIFGFGFSDVIIDDSIFAMAPTTNPKLIDHFIAYGFQKQQGISHYKIPMLPVPYEIKWDVRSADLSNPELWKKSFLELQLRVFPPTIQITPNRAKTFYDMIEFIEEFSYNAIKFAYVDDTIIGLGWASANPYDLGENGKSRSLVLFGGAVEPEYQAKGVLTQIFYSWIDENRKIGVTHGESCVSDDNIAGKKLMESWAGKPTRHHVLMRYVIN